MSEKPEVQLSCLQCQQRKRKCDKMSPCQTCVRSGTQCTPVARPRLPRGRHAIQRDGKDLRQRVARLEKLLMDRKDDPQRSQLTPPSDNDDVSNFHSAQAEIAGIKDILRDLTLDEPDDLEQTTPEPNLTQSYDLLLYGDASCFVQPDILSRPLDFVVSALLDIYYYRVNKIFKPIHNTTLHSIVLDSISTLPSHQALAFAVMYTALSSLNREECIQFFNEDKLALSRRYRLATEVYLSRAGLLATSDLLVLQAYTIYLVGYQIECGFRKAHALLAIAVRIGQSLGLESEEDDDQRTPFENEMRRRTWYSIGILDLRAAFGLGLHSALTGGALFTSPPLSINDTDFSTETITPLKPKPAFTDMTYCCATYEMLNHMRKVLHVPKDEAGRSIIEQDWQYRSMIPEECARALYQKCSQFCDPNDPFQLLTRNACGGMSITLRLIARRPMHRIKGMMPPPEDDFNVLEVATQILESSLLKADNPQLNPWSWFTWPKWYALAVLLAELCRPRAEANLERAWNVAERSFVLLGSSDQDEILWNAMKKLMRKARAIRDVSNSKVLNQNVMIPQATNTYGEIHDLDPQYSNGVLTKLEDGIFSNTSVAPISSEDLEMLCYIDWESFLGDLR